MNARDTGPDDIALPAEFSALTFEEGYARLPACFHTRLHPSPLPAPYLVGASGPAAELLGLPPAIFDRPEFVEAFAGNLILPGSVPLAAVYAGHQFGVWAGQLGDGRAHLLGRVRGPQGDWDVQIKGSGRTPYSRMGDGRAVLRSSIREFLASEAMAALGIPTTRALCVIGSDLPVRRVATETAAVVTRLAPSFVRFGSFEHWAARGRHEELRRLADHVIDDFLPELRDRPSPYAALLETAARRTAELIAQWQAVGFMHGVMNTDNMSILGLTLDYGPFGFMEAFDAAHICNHSDEAGRYAYGRQPEIARWNLYALGQSLLPLIGSVEVARAAIEDQFTPVFEQAWLARMRAKLGLRDAHADDAGLVNALFACMQTSRVDFTLFFRALATLPAHIEPGNDTVADAPIHALFADPRTCHAWLCAWRARLARENRSDAERQAAMRAVNPRYVLRNWMAESAIRQSQRGDFAEVAALLKCLSRPYDEQPEFAHYANPPPDWACGLAVSCSS